MPRKTKDQKELEIEEEKVVKKSTKKTTKTIKKETAVTKKESTKATKKEAPKTKKTATSSKPKSKNALLEIVKKVGPKKTTKTASKKTTSAKKVASKSVEKNVEKKVAEKKNEKKNSEKKASTKTTKSSEVPSTLTKKGTTKDTKKKIEIVEYYDLPYRYNQTVVKVLAQTPNNLFIYWDISDEDRENLKKQYGENFFENTKPVLIVHNDTLEYSFEVEINDFANSWYLHVNDAKCNYRIELGRKPKEKNEKINTDYIYISTSNGIEAPNDRILFDKRQKMVYFKNVKTGKISKKSINTISSIRNMEKIYDIYDLYKVIYKDEEIDDIVSNPSSGNPSSNSLLSKFM